MGRLWAGWFRVALAGKTLLSSCILPEECRGIKYAEMDRQFLQAAAYDKFVTIPLAKSKLITSKHSQNECRGGLPKSRRDNFGVLIVIVLLVNLVATFIQIPFLCKTGSSLSEDPKKFYPITACVLKPKILFSS